ncbi:Erp family outer-surface lipoprotein [Borreliella kurtenbachii]|uniref:Erp family outer-surface lipoprotein n=1 Tax=Borreliella kurtenbachii TaxID=1196056 RepID=UPI003462740B
MNRKMFVIFTIFAMISSCKNNTLSIYDEQSNSEPKVKKIEFFKFTVKIKNKDKSGNWRDLGTLVVEKKEEDGIATGLNVNPGHSSGFFSLEELEVNNFVKAMTEEGTFKASLYYGYKDEQSIANGIQNKEIKTKIEKIDDSEYITFLGDKINKEEGGEEEDDDKDRIAEYAIPLEVLKKNLK